MYRNVPTVHELRKNGSKVRVIHSRWVLNTVSGEYELFTTKDIRTKFKTLENVYTYGGQTEVRITTNENEDFTGISCCHPTEPFSYKEGVKIAIAKALGLPKVQSEFDIASERLRKIALVNVGNIKDAFLLEPFLPYRGEKVLLDQFSFKQRKELGMTYFRAFKQAMM